MRFHKPILAPGQVASLKHERVAADEVRAAEIAAQAAEDQLADWVIAELLRGRTLDELAEEWSTESVGIDLAALVDKRLDIAR